MKTILFFAQLLFFSQIALSLSAEQVLLPEDQAFQFQAVQDQQNIFAIWTIADGYYMYKDKMAFQLNNQSVFPTFPPGKQKEDRFFGNTEIYLNQISLRILLTEKFAQIREFVLTAKGQGCNEPIGICYPPMNRQQIITNQLFLDQQTNPKFSSSKQTKGISQKTQAPKTTDETASSVFQNLGQNILGYFGKPMSYRVYEMGIGLVIAAFIGGLLLTFTPCVLPLIPILSGIVVGQKEKASKTKGFSLATIYVLGTTTTYAVMGYMAGKAGYQLQAYFQNIWFISLFSALLVLLGLSMFGLFKIQLSNSIQNHIQNTTRGFGSHYFFTFLLGLFSALIMGACVSPVLISFLGLAITKADPWIGVQIMVFLSLGMGVPLILVGLGLGHYLPKTGPWMKRVNQFFGFVLIAVAIYTFGNLPVVSVLLLWGVYVLVLSLFIWRSLSQKLITPMGKNIARVVSIVLFAWGILLFMGGIPGKRDSLHPLAILSGDDQTHQQNTYPYPFKRIQSVDELKLEMSRAKKLNKAMFIDYYASWCVDCIRLEKTTFRNKKVVKILDEKFIAIQIDVTETNKNTNQLKKLFSVFGPPAIILVNNEGIKEEHRNLYGYIDNQELLQILSDF